MPQFPNFPTAAQIAPEQIPPLDDQWVESVMAEIGAFIYKKQTELQSRKIIRFVPQGRRDMGYAADQWKYHARHIAALVREHGWTAYLVNRMDGEYQTLTIAAPHAKAAEGG